MLKDNELKGKGKQISGKVKEKVGEFTEDPDLQDEGQRERIEGKVQEKIGQVESKAEKTLNKVKRAISD